MKTYQKGLIAIIIIIISLHTKDIIHLLLDCNVFNFSYGAINVALSQLFGIILAVIIGTILLRIFVLKKR